MMEKFIPYEKLSKKEKRKIDQARRQTWGDLNPVTRKPVSSKAYNRKKAQAWKRDIPPAACAFLYKERIPLQRKGDVFCPVLLHMQKLPIAVSFP